MADAQFDNNSRNTLIVRSNAASTIIRLLADSVTSRLLVDALSEEQGHGAVGSVRDEVATAGTREQLASNTCKRVHVQALNDNTNGIAVGGVTVVAASSTQVGIFLYAGQSMTFIISNTNLLYIDSITSGEGVSYTFEN